MKIFFLLLISSTLVLAQADYLTLLLLNTASEVVIPTPIYRLEMNEGSGLSMADSSGNANTFTNLGATWITGKSGSGGALQFDGVNDFGRSTASISPTTGVTNWTFCAWVWWDSYANNDDLLGELTANINNPYDGAFNINPNSSSPSGVAVFITQDAASGLKYRAESIARWPAAEWVHIAAVFDSRANSLQGEWTLYTNGVVATQTVRTTDKDQATDLRSDVFYLMSRGGTTLFGAGRLDDVGLWGSALDSATINAIKDEAR